MLLIFTLFLTAVNGSVLSNMFSNPQSFAETFQSADPAVINKVLGMMNNLIGENNADKNLAISTWEAAVVARKVAASELDKALKDRTYKEGELVVTQDKVASQIETTSLKAEQEKNAKDLLAEAKTHHGNKKAFLKAETTRIDNEKKVLEEVLTILDQLKDGNSDRKLLSVDAKVFLASLLQQGLDVDPAALKNVVTLVKALITKGEDLRQAAIQDEIDAGNDVKSAEEEYARAQKCHADAQADLEEKQQNVVKYEKEVKEARQVYQQRIKEHDAAVDDENTKNSFKESEIARVAEENSNFEEVKDVLKGLL